LLPAHTGSIPKLAPRLADIDSEWFSDQAEHLSRDGGLTFQVEKVPKEAHYPCKHPGHAERDRLGSRLDATFVDSEGAASERLEGFVLALHKRKLERFANDPEVYQLYRRVVDERPGLIHDYAARMTRLVAMILADGVRKKEYKIDDIGAAAEVVRDAVTVYVHPAHVEAAAKVGLPLEPAIKRMIGTLNVAFRSGFSIAPSKRERWLTTRTTEVS